VRARAADTEGFVESGGVKIHYEVYGDGGPTLLLMPTWTIVHKRLWKGQIPYLARHHRVVTYDGPGNGRSDRPTDSRPYDQDAQVAYALSVLDATDTGAAVLVALSQAAYWALDLAANHADRVLGTVLIGPSVAIGGTSKTRPDSRDPDGITPSSVPLLGEDPPEHWGKYDHGYWRRDFEDFLWFFFGQCFPETHSTKQIEDAVAWGNETSAEVLIAESGAHWPEPATLRQWCRQIRGPVLIVHGDDDRISPLSRAVTLAELTGGELVTPRGGGHIPLARDPVPVNLLLHDFARRLDTSRKPDNAQPRGRVWTRWSHRSRRVLFLSSPIGLGHARRDLAIATELRRRHPDIEIDWLTQHPVTRLLEEAGESVHPASAELANESAHIESEAAEHDLHCFEALRRMDEILVANFMVFHDVVSAEEYDLVIGDEAWDVDHFLHEHPELKRFAYAWLTDFVGNLPMPDDDTRQRLITADYNAEMIEHIARFPRIRDRAIFVGNPDDVIDEPFGPGLPRIVDWTRAHYDFSGYITGFDPSRVDDRAELRQQLGYGIDERICVVAVGGSGVGGHLLRRVADAFDAAAARIPGLRMIVVTGPRIDPGTVAARDGLEVRAYVPDLYRHLAASDLAIVQGGLTTCMELTAARRPFIYVPLRHHFEQNYHVAHRLGRYGAGRRLDYDDLTPDTLAAAIATEIGRDVTFRPVETEGAARAADLLADLL
jgi:pimeloyl-ACP methyl ester carboxylesterase/predicted glycosyltransferase